MEMRQSNYWYRLLLAILLLGLVAGCSDNSSNARPVVSKLLPIVFVHGQSGSAQQFETQAMRFTSNGYPQNLLFSFEYNTSLEDNPIGELDTFLDEVLAKTGASQVYAIGHSRGTSVWTTYLDDPAFGGAEKVARYVNIDGRSPEQLPGGVDTIGIWGEWNTAGSGYNRREDNSDAQIGPYAEDNYYFPGKSHTETATSSGAFSVMYRFLTGMEPGTTEVAEITSGAVNIAGRAVLFPENQGYAGTRLQIWEIDAATGHRSNDTPLATVEIGETGDFGPLELDSGRHYEFALLRPATDTFPMESVHHFYAEPYTHDNYFVRLQTSRPGESISAFIPTDEDSTGMVLLRQREFWGDQGAMADELFVNGLNVLAPEISPRTGVNLAVFTFDEGSDNVTDLDKGELFPFSALSFLTAADVFIPAMAGGGGTVELVLITRGGGETHLNVPNWPSVGNRVSVTFRDDTN